MATGNERRGRLEREEEQEEEEEGSGEYGNEKEKGSKQFSR